MNYMTMMGLIVLLCCVAANSQSIAPTSRPSGDRDEAQLARQAEVAAACRQAMASIQKDLERLVKEFPSLAGVKDATVGVAPTEDKRTGEPLPVLVSLRYHRNVTRQQTLPDADGNVPMAAERLVVEEGGIRLEVYATQGLLAVPATRSYSLPAEFNGMALRVQYYVEDNPDSQRLKQAIAGIMQKHVEAMRKSLASGNPDASQ